jgi:hypothetical protein
MPITRFWGRDADAVFARLPSGVDYYHEGDGPYVVRLSPDAVVACKRGTERVVVSDAYDPRMTIAIVTIRHPALPTDLTYAQRFGIGYPPESVAYMYREGNYSCDCNLSLFIKRYANVDIGDLECGDSVELVDLTVMRNPVTWLEKP